MGRRELIIGGAAMGLAARVNPAGFFNLQQMGTNSNQQAPGNIRVSDRERAQLRGPVKSIVQAYSRTEGKRETDYDLQGNCLSWRMKDPDGREYGDIYNYDDQGRVRSVVSHAWDGSTTEKVYSYDDGGRLLNIVDSSGERTVFEFDKQGHKIEARIPKKTDERATAVAIGREVMFADIDGSAMLDFRFRDASSFRTIYSDQDQPTETQAYVADGHLLGRVLRTYDDKGRITGVKEFIDDPMSQFPAKALEGMTVQTGISQEELRAQLAKSFSALQSESGKTYSYDSDGRIHKVILNTGMIGSFSRTYVYNDHGDVIEVHNALTRKSAIPVGVPFRPDENGKLVPDKPPSEWPPQPDFPAPPDTHYSYTYDSHGNWTEKTTTFLTSTEYSSTSRRELTYY